MIRYLYKTFLYCKCILIKLFSSVYIPHVSSIIFLFFFFSQKQKLGDTQINTPLEEKKRNKKDGFGKTMSIIPLISAILTHTDTPQYHESREGILRKPHHILNLMFHA